MESKRKKILYCITKANWGGAQKYVFDLATSVDPNVYDVAVLVGQDGALVEKLKAKNIRTIILGNMSRDVSVCRDFLAFFQILKIFYQEKPEIIHLNSSKMALLGALSGRILRVPKIIFTGHGWAFNEDRSRLQKKIIYCLHKLTIALAHKTIAVSEQTKNQIVDGVGGKSLARKMMVIRNGIGKLDFFDKETARARILEKLPSDLDLKSRVWLGTVSELHKNKGLKYLIEAMHLLDTAIDDQTNLPLVIIIGDGERREKLQERINRYNLQSNIFMVGRVEEAEKYLKAFDIFTLTSITEALPYVLLEAGQAGLPIVASAVGGVPEIITDQQDGLLVPPKEVEEIKQALEFLMNNSEKRLAFGREIQKKVRESFGGEIMIKKTLEVYCG